jgi:hypothetical protein
MLRTSSFSLFCTASAACTIVPYNQRCANRGPVGNLGDVWRKFPEGARMSDYDLISVRLMSALKRSLLNRE